MKAKPKASEWARGCLTQHIEVPQACGLEKPHQYFNSGRMKGKQTNTGLGLWGMAGIISLEKRSFRWAAWSGGAAAGKWPTQAGPGSCAGGAPSIPAPAAAGVGRAP